MGKLSTKDVISLINLIEEKVEVQDWKFNSIDVWPLIRIHLGLTLDSINTEDVKSESGKLKNHLKGLLRELLTISFKRSEFKFVPEECQVLFLTYSNAKHNKINGEWFDSFIHPLASILEKYKKKYQIIEYTNNYEYRIPGYRKSKPIQYHLLFNLIKARILSHKIEIDDCSKDIINSINKVLSKNDIQKNIISDQIFKKKISQLIVNASYFDGILKKYKPKIVLGSNYYGIELAMNYACRQLGITSIDIQHGVQGENHVAYGSWEGVPEYGYNLLPDVFAVWSDFEKKTIDDWADHTHHRSKIIGNPMAYWATEKLDKQNELTEYKDKSKINVLITLQTNNGFTETYKDLLRICEDNFYFWIRAHPVMSQSERSNIKNKLQEFNNCNFDLASDVLLYQLFPSIDVHITQNSTVTLEAATFNIPTILTHESGRDLFNREIIIGMAIYSSEPAAIKKQIRHFYDTRKSNTQVFDGRDFENSVLSMINSEL